ncbi:MAG: hypothetical protein EXR69_06835 [Myxococcales bacterium]|nr:hypothetical protein [Myxococcales bacterium]
MVSPRGTRSLTSTPDWPRSAGSPLSPRVWRPRRKGAPRWHGGVRSMRAGPRPPGTALAPGTVRVRPLAAVRTPIRGSLVRGRRRPRRGHDRARNGCGHRPEYGERDPEASRRRRLRQPPIRNARLVGRHMPLIQLDNMAAPSIRLRLTARDVALYALGVGAGENDLDLVYEGLGPVILPTFYTALAFRLARPLLRRVRGDPARAMFGEASVQITGLASPGTVLTIARSVSTYAIGPLGIAQLNFQIGEVAEVSFQIYFPGEGEPEAARPPRRPRASPPSRPPDWRVALETRLDQALIYRLSGDLNPLHVDPAAAARSPEVTGGRPILHGLCTLGFVGRAVLRGTGCPPSALRSLSARFSRPVWPGDALLVQGWEGQPSLRVTTVARPDEDVLTAVIAETKAC